ncbi:MAG: hypothetical protein PUD68_04285, partial [Clostridiales bacterium]|nr:hypothetical protein [Clostridiales bacterium]
AARRAGVFLRVDLRDHAAVARADKDWLFDAQPVKKRAQTGRKRLIGAQRLRIVEQQHLTFYNYFDDKYDLLNYCWLALAEKIRLSEYHHAPENEMLYLFFDRIYAFTKQNNELISRVLSHNPEVGYMFSRFRNFLSSQMRRIFRECPDALHKDIPNELLADHYSNTLFLVWQWSAVKDSTCEKEQAIKYLQRLLSIQ